jgi:hypothetical protein
MAKLDLVRAKELLDGFKFRELFVEELGWGSPRAARPGSVRVGDATVRYAEISQLGGVVVLEVPAEREIPDAAGRRAIHAAISRLHHENVLIFVDADRSQSLWYWVKRDGGRPVPRSHLYVQGQPADLFLSKLNAMMVDLGDFDAEGNVSVVEVTRRLRDALDVERVTRKFYREFQEQHGRFVELIEGIDDERDRKWYASILLNRLMFIYFLQRKEFLAGGNDRYLQEQLEAFGGGGGYRYYNEFLPVLFFEGFARPEAHRSPEARRMLGRIPYLNGGLFLRHRIELARAGQIRVPNAAFDALLKLFRGYDWHLDDTPGGNPNEISPDVLGYIFEKYINQKAFGAYYTRTEITEYLCEQTIHRLILQRVNSPGVPGVIAATNFDSVPELLLKLDAPLCRQLLHDVLKNLTLLDPACGSGAFLVAAMKTLVQVYSAVIGRIKFLADADLSDWLERTETEHPSINYFIKKRIIADNLFGVDLMEEATEIAKLRLFLALVASVKRAEDLEPLPNLDFNILPGNSLIGLLHVDEQRYDAAQQELFAGRYRALVNEKTQLVERYRHTSSLDAVAEAVDRAATTSSLQELREEIDRHRSDAIVRLNEMLLDEFGRLGIRYEEATWDLVKNKEGKPRKRPLSMQDIRDLHPFHWGYEFDEVIHGRGGFDAIITNPPWDAFKPNAKEFFEDYSSVVTKNKMTIKEFEKERALLLQDAELRRAWEEYLSRFPHANLWFRQSVDYRAIQVAPIVNGKKASIDLNLYKLFLERCFRLLRGGGECGIVVPSGIYTDLGSMGLREMLFTQALLRGLFGFENRKEVFEGVHRSLKFVVLVFEKGPMTETFPAAFMRHDVAELASFPRDGAVSISIDLVRKLAPDSLSIPEYRSAADLEITEKVYRFPSLGPEMPYERYRVGFRDVTASTNERTMIATVLPNHAFTGNTVSISRRPEDPKEILVLVGLLNSYVIDWLIRQRVTNHCNFFYVYQLPVPRLNDRSGTFAPIVDRVARLVCTTPEFDSLASEVGLGGHADGATDPAERARLRAELDGLVAHLYGLTEEEFAHILDSFPLVAQEIKDAALNAFRALASNPDDAEVERLIAAGENSWTEFKVAAAWNPHTMKKDENLRWNVVREVAAFRNSREGGNVFVGVADDGTVVGLAQDYAAADPNKPTRDGYELFLRNVLSSQQGVGAAHTAACQITFHTVDGNDVCRIHVPPASGPAYAGGDFYVRSGNQARKLSAQEAHSYVASHWT